MLALFLLFVRLRRGPQHLAQRLVEPPLVRILGALALRGGALIAFSVTGHNRMAPFHTAHSRPTAAQYEAIGRVAANWSVVEFAVERILARLACAPDFPALALTNDLSMDNRLTAMRNLIATHRFRYGARLISEEWLLKFEDVPAEVAKAKDLRNKITHLVWYRITDEKLFGTKFKGKPPSGHILEPYQLTKTTTELNQFADYLDDLGSRLFDLAGQMPEIDESLLRIRF